MRSCVDANLRLSLRTVNSQINARKHTCCVYSDDMYVAKRNGDPCAVDDTMHLSSASTILLRRHGGTNGRERTGLPRQGEGGEDDGEYRHSSVVFATSVCYEGKTYRCGTYHTAEGAACAYDAKLFVNLKVPLT